MPAKFEVRFRVAERRSRFRVPDNEAVEGDTIEYDSTVTNEGSSPFPPKDMLVTTTWQFPSNQGHTTEVALRKGQLAPGESTRATGRVNVLWPGYALAFVHYTPYGDGCVLHDSGGGEISPLTRGAVASFRGAGIVELATLRALRVALYVAAVATVAAMISIGGLVVALKGI